MLSRHDAFRKVGCACGLLVACGAVLVQAAADRGGAPAGGQSPVAADARSLSHGRALYSRHCAECHGPSGRGDGTAGRDLDPVPTNLTDDDVGQKTDAELFRKITRGRRPMPSFRRLLSDDDRWDLVNYVRTLSPPHGGAR